MGKGEGGIGDRGGHCGTYRERAGVRCEGAKQHACDARGASQGGRDLRPKALLTSQAQLLTELYKN